MSFIKKRKIVHSILVPYLVIFVVLVCLIVDGTTTYLGNRIEALLGVEAGNSLSHALSILERENHHFYAAMREVASRPVLAEALSRHDLDAVRTVVRQLYVEDRHDEIRVLDDKGLVVAALVGKAEMRKSFLGEEETQRLLQGGEIVGVKSCPEGLGVQAVVPVRYKGRIVGGVAAYRYWRQEECRVVAEQIGSEIFLFDGKRLVASSVELANETGPLRISPIVEEKVLGKGEWQVVHLFLAGREYAVAFAPMESADQKIVGMLVAAKDASLLGALLRGVIQTAFGYSVLGLVVVIFIAVLIARGISMPIRKLAAVTARVAAGDLTARAEINRRDEIGQLAASFNAMTEKLAATRSQLVAANEFAENIIRSVSEALIIVGADEVILSVNAAAAKLLGYQDKELIGREVEVIVARENPAGLLQDILAEIVSGRSVFERDIFFFARSGETIPMSVSGSCARSETGAPLAIVLSARDLRDSRLLAEVHAANEQLHLEIAERLRVEEKLRASEEKHRALFELAVEGILVTDVQTGQFCYANAAIGKLLGYEVAELLTMRMADISPPAMRVELSAAGRTGKGGARIIPCRHKDGSILSVQVSSTCMSLDGRSCLVGFFSDVTEREQVHAALKKAKEMAESASKAKTAFLAKVSHELRTPMNGILGFTGMLLDSELTPVQKRHLGFVKTAATGLLSLVDDVLGFVKVETANLTLANHDFRLRESLAEEMTLHERRAMARGLRCSWQVEDDVPDSLYGDDKRLRQVINRLVDNGIRFTRAGEIKLALAVEEKTANRVLLHFSVQDTGVGIPLAQQEAVFQSFTQVEDYYTRQHGGLGLGLSLSAQLVHLMGGDIWLESTTSSEEGESGSTFHFTVGFDYFA